MTKQDFGWREKTVYFLTNFFFKPTKHPWIYTNLTTPDHLTLVKMITTVIVITLLVKESLTPEQFIISIVICILSDLFDGPLKRVLTSEEIGVQPKPLFLSEYIPMLQGGQFDTITDKIAIATGIWSAIYFGFPVAILIIMVSAMLVKLVCSFHGGWVIGLKYSDLGKALLGKAPDNFAKKLKEYGVKSNQSIIEGQIEAFCQSMVLLLAAFWAKTDSMIFIFTSYILGTIAVAAGFTSYRLYVKRFLTQNGATFSSKPVKFLTSINIDLPYLGRNQRPLPLFASKVFLFLSGYWLAGPKNKM